MVGNSGSGKSTLARRLAEAMDVPLLELDSVFHQPGWQELPTDEFRARVADFAAGDAWVIDGNYSVVQQPCVWPRADTVVWLDLPRHLVIRQVAGRSIRRVVRREELWNGNRERVRNLLAWDPETSIIRWSWTSHHKYRAKYDDGRVDPRWSHITFIRLGSHAEAAELVAEVSR